MLCTRRFLWATLVLGFLVGCDEDDVGSASSELRKEVRTTGPGSHEPGQSQDASAGARVWRPAAARHRAKPGSHRPGGRHHWGHGHHRPGSGDHGCLGVGGAAGQGSDPNPPEMENGWATEAGGFYRACGYSGFAWTAADQASTISPADYSAVPAGGEFCAQGSVAASPEYSGVAMIGFNLGQAEPDSPNVAVLPQGTGVWVQVTQQTPAPLRVHIQDGADDSRRWCADLPGEGGFIPWADFNTHCWDNSGDFYDQSPISQLLVLVPGDGHQDTPFDFCVQGFGTDACGGTPGTGGAGGQGTGGAGGQGTGGSPPVCEEPIGHAGSVPGTFLWSVEEHGFITACDWQGYAWTAIDSGVDGGTPSLICPAEFSSLQEDDRLCAEGVVGARDDWGGFAIVGFNLGQEVEDEAVASITPTGEGIQVAVSNYAGSALRVQIQGPNGGDDANDRWCAALPDGESFVPWGAFNTQCWDDSGEFYQGEPLQNVLVLVPGSNTEDTPYDFCIDGAYPSDPYEPGSCALEPYTGGPPPPPPPPVYPPAECTDPVDHGSGAPGSAEWAVHDGAFVTACGWTGYAWTATGGNGTALCPEDISSTMANDRLCINGVVSPDQEYGGFAMLGINLAQSLEGEADSTVSPSGTGLELSVENFAGTGLRVMLTGPNGDTDENDRWCANLEAGSQSFVEWSEFNTACWDDSGEFYSGEPLKSIAVFVPGDNTEEVPFDFCLDGMHPDIECGVGEAPLP